jgi:hypothetical protein
MQWRSGNGAESSINFFSVFLTVKDVLQALCHTAVNELSLSCRRRLSVSVLVWSADSRQPHRGYPAAIPDTQLES